MREGMPELLTIPEAAMVAKCSAPTIRRAIDRGELDAVRIGRLIRIDAASLTRTAQVPPLKPRKRGAR